jgi:hypothetical protein
MDSLEQPFQILVLIGMVFVALGLWSALSRARSSVAAFGPSARNLFLGVRVTATHTPSGSFSGVTAHVLRLTPREATLVSPRYVGRGETLQIDLGGLPDGPTGDLPAQVLQVWALPGEPMTYLLTVRFGKLPAEARQPFVQFVQRLAENGRLAPV